MVYNKQNSPSYIFITEKKGYSIIQIPISLAKFLVSFTLKHLKDESFKLLIKVKDELEYAKDTEMINLSDLLQVLSIKGKDCNDLTDELKKLYCLKNRYEIISKSLNELYKKCNQSDNETECKLKVKESIIENNNNLNDINTKIKDKILDNSDLNRARGLDNGVYYGGSDFADDEKNRVY